MRLSKNESASLDILCAQFQRDLASAYFYTFSWHQLSEHFHYCIKNIFSIPSFHHSPLSLSHPPNIFYSVHSPVQLSYPFLSVSPQYIPSYTSHTHLSLYTTFFILHKSLFDAILLKLNNRVSFSNIVRQ